MSGGCDCEGCDLECIPGWVAVTLKLNNPAVLTLLQSPYRIWLLDLARILVWTLIFSEILKAEENSNFDLSLSGSRELKGRKVSTTSNLSPQQPLHGYQGKNLLGWEEKILLYR
jgi:hypothetical protein